MSALVYRWPPILPGQGNDVTAPGPVVVCRSIPIGGSASVSGGGSTGVFAPLGYVDQATATGARGWAADQDRTSSSQTTGTITILIYLDDVLADTVQTGESRPDVSTAYPALNSISGWSSVAPAALNDGSRHKLTAFAVDEDASLVQLTGSPYYFYASGTPPTINTSALVLDMYDGVQGVGWHSWNNGPISASMLVPWSNPGGDWADASNVPQGGSAYTTHASSAGTASILSLFRDWVSKGNTGAILIQTGDTAYAGRNYPDASLRPKLVVTTPSGTYTCACTAYNSFDAGSAAGVPAQGDGWVRSFSRRSGIQFAINGVANAGAATAAVVTLSPTGYIGGNVSWFRCTPYPTTSQWDLKPGGISAPYTSLAALAADPHVLFATDWDSTTVNKFTDVAGGGWTWDTGFGTDPVIGKYVAPNFHPGQYEPMSGWRAAAAAGISQISEGYIRYAIRFRSNFYANDGCKMGVGLSGRGGAQGIGAHLTVVCANGGSESTGLWYASGGPGPYTCGWSARPWVQQACNDSSNPLDPYVIPFSYLYWSTMVADSTAAGNGSVYGQCFRWAGVLFQKDVWYIIEIYIKMNTVTGADGDGNGTAARDGQYKVWVNGNPVPVLDPWTHNQMTGLPWTKNTGRITINEIPWLDTYLGGTADPTGTFNFDIGPIIIADAYIGPTGFAPTPSWMPAHMTWGQVPNTALNPHLDIGPLVALGYNNGNSGSGGNPLQTGWDDYSGGTLDRYRSMMMRGPGAGGASALRPNAVIGCGLEPNAPVWTYVVASTTIGNTYELSAPGSPHETNIDGTLQSHHTGNSPWWCHALGKFFSVLPMHTWDIDLGGTNNIWRVDNPYTPLWTKVNGGAELPIGGTAIGRWDYPPQCEDFGNGKRYIVNASKIVEYDPIADTSRVITSDLSNGGDRGYCQSNNNGKILWLGAYNGSSTTVTLYIDEASGAFTQGTLTGPGAAALNSDGNAWSKGWSFCFSDGTGKYYAFIDDGNLYSIQRLTDSSFYADVLTLGGTAPTVNHTAGVSDGPGIRGRVAYAPRLRGVVLDTKADTDIYFVQTD